MGVCAPWFDEFTAEGQIVNYYKLDCWTDNMKTRFAFYDVNDPTCSSAPVHVIWMDPVTCNEGSLAVCHADSSFMKKWEGLTVYPFFPTEADARANNLDSASAILSGPPLNTVKTLPKDERIECNTDIQYSGQCVDTRNVKSIIQYTNKFDSRELQLYSHFGAKGQMTSVNNEPIYYHWGSRTQTERFLVHGWYKDNWQHA